MSSSKASLSADGGHRFDDTGSSEAVELAAMGSSNNQQEAFYAPRLETTIISSLPPVDRGKDAWLFLAGATVIEAMVWGLPFSVGILRAYWSERLFPDEVYHAGGTLTLTATLHSGLPYIYGAVCGPLHSTFPKYQWHLQMSGLVIASLGLVLSAFAKQPWHLVVTLGLMYPFASLIYMPAATLIFEWFQIKRGLASGILYAGTGAGGTAFPFIVQGMLDTYGYKPAMISLGIGYFCLSAIAIIPCKRRVPVTTHYHLDDALSSHGELPHRSRMRAINWSFLRHSPFYAFAASILLASLGNFLPSIWIPTFAIDLNVRRPDGTSLLAIMNAVSVPGLLLLGYLSDHWPLRIVITLSCLGSALACLLLWGFSTNFGALIAFVVIFGLLGPSYTVLWTKMIAIVANDDPALPPLVFSLFALMRGVGNITSGPVSEALLKLPSWTGAKGAYGFRNYGALLLYTGVTMLGGSAVGVVYSDPA